MEKKETQIDILVKKVQQLEDQLEALDFENNEQNENEEFKLLNQKVEMLEKDNLNFKETIEKLEKNDEDLIEQMDLLGPIINIWEILILN